VTTWVRKKLPPILTAAGKPQALLATTAVPATTPLADLQSQLVALSAQIATLQNKGKRGREKNARRGSGKNETGARQHAHCVYYRSGCYGRGV
jgi:hypothetical protein